MVITDRIRSQYFAGDDAQTFIRIAQSPAVVPLKSKRSGTPWTADEHDRFLAALEQYPSGPWKVIASYVGSRTTRQTMTHAQKYRERIARMKRVADEQTAASRTSAVAVKSVVSTASSPPPSSPVDDTITIKLDQQQQQQRQHSFPHSSLQLQNAFAHCDAASEFLSLGSDASVCFPLSGNEIDEMYNATVHALVDTYEPFEISDDLWQQVLGDNHMDVSDDDMFIVGLWREPVEPSVSQSMC